MAGERILVVDDNAGNREFLVEHLLVPSGYVPMVAANGRQGLEMAFAEKPDLMILDSRLPEMSGVEVLRALREKQVDIPVVFITAYGSETDVVDCFRLGIKDYLSKPFDAQEMLSTVERVLRERRQQEQRSLQQQALEGYVKELGALYGSSLERVLNHIVEAAVAITNAEEGYLLLVDGDTNELYMRSALNIGERLARGFRLKIEDSVSGRVVRTGQPVRYNYLDEFDRFKVKTNYLVKALLNVPLCAEDKVIGVLGVDNKSRAEVFSRTDLDLLTSLAEHAANAIQNASLYEQTHKALIAQVHKLSAMQEAARDLNAVVDVDRIASLVLRYATRMIPAEAGLVGLLVADQARWTPHGYIAQALEDETWQPQWDAGIIGRAISSRQSLLVHDVRAESDGVHGLPQTNSQLAVPILWSDQVMGVVDLESTRVNAFSESNQRFLLALADYAAVAIENARLFDLVVGEQSKNRLILQSIADGVYTVDCDLCVCTLNPAAERITGWREEEVRGLPCAEVFPDVGGNGQSHQALLIQEVLRTGRPVASAPDAPPIVGRDGRVVFASSSVSPLRNREGGVVGVVVAFRDVSAERQFDRLKSDFVSMVSHELRSPLANLSAAVELMLNSTQDQGEVRSTLHIARDNTRRLARLIENILSVSQIEAGQMVAHPEPTTLLPVVRRVAGMVQAETDAHRITIRTPDSIPFVMADPSKLEVVLSNLLTNAVNYSPDGGRIVVRIADATQDELEISVIDEGIGIPEVHMARIFDQFYRVDTSDGRKVYGYGLGLYISKRMVELQGGRIWAQSREGVGSCFSFTLPIVRESEIIEEVRSTASRET